MSIDNLMRAMDTMQERAHALEQSPDVSRAADDPGILVAKGDWRPISEMMLQGVDAPSREVIALIETYAQFRGVSDEFLGALLEMIVLGSLIGRTDR